MLLATDELELLAEEWIGWEEGGLSRQRNLLVDAVEIVDAGQFLQWLWERHSRLPLRYEVEDVCIDTLYFFQLQYCLIAMRLPLTKRALARKIKALGASKKRVGRSRRTLYSLPRIRTD